jgi:uncharacterized protein YutE (UPF0331/DUF86 family)
VEIRHDAILGKISNIQNCLKSIEKITKLDAHALNDQFKQDVFVLNLERATQACIDLANLVIADRAWELPRSYHHSFEILSREEFLSPELAKKMVAMAGFRNIAVHDYTKINVEILKSILTKNLKDIEDFYSLVYRSYFKDAEKP